METFFGSKSEENIKDDGIFSQYITRPEETPDLVTHICVMLSRISSGERPSGTPSKLREISCKLTGSWSNIQAARPMGESAIPYSVCVRSAIRVCTAMFFA